MSTSRPRLYDLFTNKRVLTIALLGFASGLPFSLVLSTLQSWFAVEQISIVRIGIMGLVGVPYSIKFLWAPLMDRYTPIQLGRRRGWMLICQLFIAMGLFVLSFYDPQHDLLMMGYIAFILAFLSASQDIAIDAYRTDILPPEERGLGAAMNVGGYRLAMIASAAGALIIAAYVGWANTYRVMALLMASFAYVSYKAPEPIDKVSPPKTIKSAVIEPFHNFLTRDHAIALLLLVTLYKLGEAFASTLLNPFLLQGVGFSLVEVGAVSKVVGLLSSILGTFVGGALLARISLFSGLLYFGILQAISNLAFMWLAIVGKSHVVMALSITVENFCGGLGTAAFVALLMSLCDRRYTATQYALLSAPFAAARFIVSPISGYIIAHFGWANFFLGTFFASLPGLMLLFVIRDALPQPDAEAAYA